MIEYKYEVWCAGEKLASDMNLENAVMFIKSYLFEYYAVNEIEISIKRKARDEL